MNGWAKNGWRFSLWGEDASRSRQTQTISGPPKLIHQKYNMTTPLQGRGGGACHIASMEVIPIDSHYIGALKEEKRWAIVHAATSCTAVKGRSPGARAAAPSSTAPLSLRHPPSPAPPLPPAAAALRLRP